MAITISVERLNEISRELAPFDDVDIQIARPADTLRVKWDRIRERAARAGDPGTTVLCGDKT